MHAPVTLQQLAGALDGHVVGREVRCPGPGHSRRDDSLAVAPTPESPDGFIVHSHAGDDWRECKAYVRERLGLPADMRSIAAKGSVSIRTWPHRPQQPE